MSRHANARSSDPGAAAKCRCWLGLMLGSKARTSSASRAKNQGLPARRQQEGRHMGAPWAFPGLSSHGRTAP
jgi:hypothetical protein